MSTASHHRPLYRVVTLHYLLAGLFFLLLAVMFFFALESLSGHYFQPRILALTHVAALGWGSMIIFGALYQLLPVLLETKLHSVPLAWCSLTFLVPGIVMLVCSFWIFDAGICMQMASLLVLSGISCFCINVFLTVKGSKKESVFREFILTSCMWLMLTVLLGALMVFNFRYSFLEKNHLDFLRLHAHMGIAGWFLMLIIGVSARLVPMFLISKYQKTSLLSVCYYILNAALLLFIIDGYLNGINNKTYLILILGVLGCSFYLSYIFRCYQSRIRNGLDLPMLKTMFSFLLLVAGLFVLPFILYYHLKGSGLALNLSILYGILLFMGWITSLVLGQTFKTLPFIVWAKHYEGLAGKVQTPLPADLVNSRLLYLQSFAFVLFLLTIVSGFLFDSAILKLVASACLILTALIYVLQLFLLLFHKTKIKPYEYS